MPDINLFVYGISYEDKIRMDCCRIRCTWETPTCQGIPCTIWRVTQGLWKPLIRPRLGDSTDDSVAIHLVTV